MVFWVSIDFRSYKTYKLIQTEECIKGIAKFWYGVMNLVQMNISEAYICDFIRFDDRCRGWNRV